MTNETARRIENLKRWDADCAAAAEWLEKNKDKFQMEVFQPLCISINVPEKPYQSAVEACINSGQMRVCCCSCSRYPSIMLTRSSFRSFRPSSLNARKITNFSISSSMTNANRHSGVLEFGSMCGIGVSPMSLPLLCPLIR